MGIFKRNRKGSGKAAAWKNRKNHKRTAESSKAVKDAEPVQAEDIAVAEESASAEPEVVAVIEETAAKEQTETAAPESLAAAVDAARVFDFFREISAIPRGSFHTDAISDYLVSFAAERGLECVQDTTNNVIITKKASAGAEDADPIALQGHIDMVLASRPDKDIDMLTTPVTIVVEGDWMHADGTTLGADNGIAVAMMLAILDDDTLVHPELECIFTSDEEVGLIGASAIDLSGLKSRRLLNLDSEEEGVFCAGCAGGAEVVCEMPFKRKLRTGRILRIKVTGLCGGHSGADIHYGRANANVLMSRVLYRLAEQFQFRLISIDGGDADNAIATSSEAVIMFRQGEDPENILISLGKITDEIRAEYTVTDPDMEWSASWDAETAAKAVSRKSTRQILDYLLSLPNGITAMNPVLKNEPQTSLNLGIMRTGQNGLEVEFMVRSGVNSQTDHLSQRLVCITRGFGGKPFVRSSYPAWEFKNDSPFRDLATDVYRKVNGTEAGVEVIHAGLECGILSGKVDGLDCISTGPNLENVHTVKERMSISSVERVWNFVLALLNEAAVR